MDKTMKDNWVAELRSGRRKRTTSRLEHRGAYCPLGVLAVMNGVPIRDEHGSEEPAYAWLTEVLRPLTPSDIYTMNDLGDHDFQRLADWVEEHVPVDEPV